jgi:hypothetical protein
LWPRQKKQGIVSGDIREQKAVMSEEKRVQTQKLMTSQCAQKLMTSLRDQLECHMILWMGFFFTDKSCAGNTGPTKSEVCHGMSFEMNN